MSGFIIAHCRQNARTEILKSAEHVNFKLHKYMSILFERAMCIIGQYCFFYKYESRAFCLDRLAEKILLKEKIEVKMIHSESCVCALFVTNSLYALSR